MVKLTTSMSAPGRTELESHSEIPNDIPGTNSRGQERPAIASKLLEVGNKLSPTLRNPAPEPEPEPDCEEDTPAPGVGMPVNRPRMPVHGLTGVGWGTGPGGVCGGISGRSVRERLTREKQGRQGFNGTSGKPGTIVAYVQVALA